MSDNNVGDGTTDQGTDTTGSPASNIDKAKQVASGAKDKASATAKKAGEKMPAQVKDTYGKVSSKAGDAAKKATPKVKDTYGKVSSKVKGLVKSDGGDEEPAG